MSRHKQKPKPKPKPAAKPTPKPKPKATPRAQTAGKPKQTSKSTRKADPPGHSGEVAALTEGMLGLVLVLLLAWLLYRVKRRRQRFIPSDAPSPTPAGGRLGNYQLVRKLAEGGTASVYLGTDPAGVEVAIKIPHQDQLRNPQFVATFKREAEIGVDLRHPSIVRVLETGSYKIEPVGEIPYFVMEYLEGADLETVIAHDGQIPAEEAAQIVRAVADALQWAHQRGVIHRDISPRNIFLTSKRSIKVMDFGISAVFARTGPRGQLGKSLNYGTPEYLAPERSQGQAADQRSDLYALGCVFFEMLTGHPPFPGLTPEEIIESHRKSPVPKVSDEVRVPPRVESIVMRLLEKDPKQRYQTAGEVTSDLADLIPVV